jgi:hypothetical protein
MQTPFPDPLTPQKPILKGGFGKYLKWPGFISKVGAGCSLIAAWFIFLLPRSKYSNAE